MRARATRCSTSCSTHIEQDQFIYAHHWRVGDLVLWDNRCTLHARTDFSDKERRLLRRHVVTGDRAY